MSCLESIIPFFQGGMAWVADASLASAVSNAGGLGIIAGGNAPKRSRKKKLKVKELTEQPFGVNIMLLSPLPMKLSIWFVKNRFLS